MEYHDKLDQLLSLDNETARITIEESIDALYVRYIGPPASEQAVPD